VRSIHCFPPNVPDILELLPALFVSRRVVFSDGGLNRAQEGPQRTRFLRGGVEKVLYSAAASPFRVVSPRDCRICRSALAAISNPSILEAFLGRIMLLPGGLCRGDCKRLFGRRFEDVLKPTGELWRRATPAKRGFCQGDEIARGFVRLRPLAGIQLGTETVARTRETVVEAGPTRHPRQASVPGALAVTRPERLCQREIPPVDAVMTRGEYAPVFMRAGATKVLVATEAPATRKAESVVAVAAAAGWGGALGHA
jgi:hypothetical protein